MLVACACKYDLNGPNNTLQIEYSLKVNLKDTVRFHKNYSLRL